MSEEKQPNKNMRPGVTWFYLIAFLAITLYWFFGMRQTVPETSWNRFSKEMLIKGDVKSIQVINNERVEVTIKKDSLGKSLYSTLPKDMFSGKVSEGPHYFFNIGSVEVFNEKIDKLTEAHPFIADLNIKYSKRTDWISTLLSWLLPIGLVILFWLFILRRMGSGGSGIGSAFSFGKSKARVLEKGTETNVTFEDVAGLEEAKEEIFEIVSFLKSPEKYRRLGAKIPKGILLSGPPGSGKTLLAKAVAGEAGVPFFSLSGSEFVEMFVGVGAARMRDLFQQAKAKAPSIVFIDEIDTIGRVRSKAAAFQTNEERESTLNQLLAELDGFDTNAGVIVLAATNRGDILDPALLRPGRFDRHIHLELPSLKERKEIFKVHMKTLTLSKDVDVDIISAQTPGFSGADIMNICNEAALIAARKGMDEIHMQEFMDAIDRVIGGLEKKSKIITPEEKKRVAYHESGHVIAGWFLKNTPPISKVTIIPRGRSLGAAWYLPEERQVITRSQFEDTICMLLGGRVAEEIVYNEVSSNALDDLENVTKQAYTMVMNYGLSDVLKNLSYYDSTGRLENSFQKPYSEKTAQMIDDEVNRIVDRAHDQVKNILLEHRGQLDQLASTLAEKETLKKEDIEVILGARESR